MLVYEADGLTDRAKPDANAWYVADGLCGFAWVNVKPATNRVAKALVEHATARDFGTRKDSYYGGVTVWVGVGNQSHARKCAAADAFARVIEQWAERTGEPVRVWVGDRLD